MQGRYQQTVAPLVEPLEVADCQEQAQIDDGVQESLVENLIAVAREKTERTLTRQLITATWQLVLPCFAGYEIKLARPPVQAITSIQYVDDAGDTQTLDTAKHQLEATDPDRPGVVSPSYGNIWPTTRPETAAAVTITFTAGYGDAKSDVPIGIRHAMLMLVAHWFDMRHPVADAQAMPIPYGVDALLNQHRWGHYE